MTTAQARRQTAQSATEIVSPAASDLIGMFVERNPNSSRGEVAEVGKLVAEFSAVAAKVVFPTSRKKRLIAR